jgi:hypothetical protein
MADKEGVERKVWLLPTELSDRIKAYQMSQGITSEVEAARRLLDAALQLRDTVPDILRKLKDRFAEEKDLRVLARDILVAHTLVNTVHFDEDGMWFRFKDGGLGRLDKRGRAFTGDDDNQYNGEPRWDEFPEPQPAPRAGVRSGGPSWDAPEDTSMDEEIPF